MKPNPQVVSPHLSVTASSFDLRSIFQVRQPIERPKGRPVQYTSKMSSTWSWYNLQRYDQRPAFVINRIISRSTLVSPYIAPNYRLNNSRADTRRSSTEISVAVSASLTYVLHRDLQSEALDPTIEWRVTRIHSKDLECLIPSIAAGP